MTTTRSTHPAPDPHSLTAPGTHAGVMLFSALPRSSGPLDRRVCAVVGRGAICPVDVDTLELIAPTAA